MEELTPSVPFRRWNNHH